MKTSVTIACALILGLSGSVAMAADGSQNVVQKVQQCAACHGLHGIATADNFPILAGQHESYLLHALKQYKSGARKNAIMNGMAASLSNKDMKALAHYFASQPTPLKTLPVSGLVE